MQCSYGVGAVVVRRERDLTKAFAMDDVYCPPGVDAHDGDEDDESGSSAVASIADMGLELTRESRGAQFWLPLRAHGTEAFTAHLEWCLEATQWLANELRQSKHIEIVTPATLCTFTFRVVVPQMNGSSYGQLAQWLTDAVNERGALIAPTKVQGVAVVRVWCAELLMNCQHGPHLVVFSVCLRTSPQPIAACVYVYLQCSLVPDVPRATGRNQRGYRAHRCAGCGAGRQAGRGERRRASASASRRGWRARCCAASTATPMNRTATAVAARAPRLLYR